MYTEFIIEVLVKPNANQPIPTEEELDDLEDILIQCVDLYLDRLADEANESDEEEDDADAES